MIVIQISTNKPQDLFILAPKRKTDAGKRKNLFSTMTADEQTSL